MEVGWSNNWILETPYEWALSDKFNIYLLLFYYFPFIDHDCVEGK